MRDIATETNALGTVVIPVLLSDVVVPQCAVPFADAHAVKVVTPAYPVIGSINRESGKMQVKVTLDDTGAVTDATTHKSSGAVWLSTMPV